MLRTYTCGELREGHIGKEATLCGWVHSRRDHGDLIFTDIRDAYGITQVVFDPAEDRDLHIEAHKLRGEYVVQVVGLVRNRPEGTLNSKIPTGMIEVLARKIHILNVSDTPPFEIDESTNVSEEMRIKYRYIDLRKPLMQQNLRMRHRATKIIRDYMDEKTFVDVETPILTKSTPEGARDYLVPSRVNKGHFYALPQSPQLFKQILMVAGLDRYYQIARCFRDEDLRADRQPEFTQLDIEMSFIEEDDIFSLCEGLIGKLFKKIAGIDIPLPFPRIAYRDALRRFGTDKPDTRIPVELKEVTEVVRQTNFNVFKNVIKSGGIIVGLRGIGCASLSLSKINELISQAQELGAKGLAYLKIEEDKIQSPIQKFFKKEELDSLVSALGGQPGDILFFVADKKEICYQVLGAVRLVIAKLKDLTEKDRFDFLWVTDFPLFKYNDDEKHWESEHHPFTSCKDDDVHLLDKGDYANIRSQSYDLVINGVEMASGSIRIHSRDIQKKIFDVIGIQEEEAQARFGFLMDAFKFGAPPHGGIALGLDRFITLFTKSESIRDVIAFPKTQRAICPMTGAPSLIDEKQLTELQIRIIK